VALTLWRRWEPRTAAGTLASAATETPAAAQESASAEPAPASEEALLATAGGRLRRGQRLHDRAAAAEAVAPDPAESGAQAAPGDTAVVEGSEEVAPAEVDTTSVTIEPVATATPAALVSTRCPYGLVNDPYPGRCRRYVDANGNGYCDYSEIA